MDTKSSRWKKFIALPATTVYEASGQLGDMSPDVQALVPGARLAGFAFTVKCYPSDMAAVIRAIDEASAGDVLVVDAGGTARGTIWGGNGGLAAQARGIAGVVTNGGARDVDDLIALGMPVYATGVSLRGTVKSHPGWVGIPVSVGGVCVNPGDFVMGDRDGVVVVPRPRLDEVVERAFKKQEQEDAKAAYIRSGKSLVDYFNLRHLFR